MKPSANSCLDLCLGQRLSGLFVVRLVISAWSLRESLLQFSMLDLNTFFFLLLSPGIIGVPPYMLASKNLVCI